MRLVMGIAAVAVVIAVIIVAVVVAIPRVPETLQHTANVKQTGSITYKYYKIYQNNTENAP